MWSTRATLPEIFGKKGVPKGTIYGTPTLFFGDIKGLYVLCVCASLSLTLCTLDVITGCCRPTLYREEIGKSAIL